MILQEGLMDVANQMVQLVPMPNKDILPLDLLERVEMENCRDNHPEEPAEL